MNINRIIIRLCTASLIVLSTICWSAEDAVTPTPELTPTPTPELTPTPTFTLAPAPILKPTLAPTPEPLDSSSMIMQIITALGGVTACIFLMAWVAKRFGAGRMLQPKGLRVLASMALGAKEKVVLIEVEHTKILLGVAAGHVSRLHVFDREEEGEHEDDEVPEVDDEEVRRVEEKWDFARYLKGMIKDGNRQ